MVWSSKRTSWNLHVDCWEAFHWTDLEETTTVAQEFKRGHLLDKSFSESWFWLLRSSKLLHLQFVSSLKHQIFTDHGTGRYPDGFQPQESINERLYRDSFDRHSSGTAFDSNLFWILFGDGWRLSFRMILYMQNAKKYRSCIRYMINLTIWTYFSSSGLEFWIPTSKFWKGFCWRRGPQSCGFVM